MKFDSGSRFACYEPMMSKNFLFLVLALAPFGNPAHAQDVREKFAARTIQKAYRNHKRILPSQLALEKGVTHFVHCVPVGDFAAILESGTIKPRCNTRASGYQGNSCDPTVVYLQGVNKQEFENVGFLRELLKNEALSRGNLACFVFSPEVLDLGSDFHISLGWDYGKYSARSARPQEHPHFSEILEEIGSQPVNLLDPHVEMLNEIVIKGDIALKSPHLIEIIHLEEDVLTPSLESRLSGNFLRPIPFPSHSRSEQIASHLFRAANCSPSNLTGLKPSIEEVNEVIDRVREQIKRSNGERADLYLNLLDQTIQAQVIH